MVLRAHLLALSPPLLRPLPYSPQECYIPCLSRSLAGFTTQFEEPPYRAPSSTLLAPEYSENSEATRRRTNGQHMSTEFLRDPRNEHGTLNPGNCLRCTHPLADPLSLSCLSRGNPRSWLEGPGHGTDELGRPNGRAGTRDRRLMSSRETINSSLKGRIPVSAAVAGRLAAEVRLTDVTIPASERRHKGGRC